MEKQIRKDFVQASFTIEAAVIVPLSLIIVMTVILLCFFIHDRVMLTAGMAEAVFTEASAEEPDLDNMIESAGSLITTKQIMASGTETNGSESLGSYTLEAESAFDWRFSLVRELFDNALGGMDAEVKISNLDGRDILLRYRLIRDGLDLINGGETGNN
ncbi:MAG: pilus assembly protein [Parasporobacterium sp.]|nr:pilus assembly protein [Parasporobacterium sp.]